jgi:hypothetical protein
MVSVGLTFVPIATMTYVSDCYLPVNADALELVNGLKASRSQFVAHVEMLTCRRTLSPLGSCTALSLG